MNKLNKVLKPVAKIILDEGTENNTEVNVFENTKVKIIGKHTDSGEIVYEGSIEDLLYHLWVNKV